MSEFPRLFFMNLISRYRKTAWAPFTKCGLSVLLEYSIPLPLGCLNSARASSPLQAAASLSNLFLREGPHFSDSTAIISHQSSSASSHGKPWGLPVKAGWGLWHSCCQHQLASMRPCSILSHRVWLMVIIALIFKSIHRANGSASTGERRKSSVSASASSSLCKWFVGGQKTYTLSSLDTRNIVPAMLSTTLCTCNINRWKDSTSVLTLMAPLV